MKTKRVILYGILLWLLSFILYLPSGLIPIFKENAFYGYVYFWVLLIPVVLLWSKAFFKSVPPTWQRGLQLGVWAIIIAFVLDFLTISPLIWVESFDVFKETIAELYIDWKFWLTILEILALTTFAGWEFDSTYSKPDKK